VVAPTLGGVILDHLAWQWIFYVNVPIGAVALLAAWHVLPNLVVCLQNSRPLRE